MNRMKNKIMEEKKGLLQDSLMKVLIYVEGFIMYLGSEDGKEIDKFTTRKLQASI